MGAFLPACDKVWLFIVLFIRQKGLMFVWDGKAPFLEEQKETWALREETEGETAVCSFLPLREEVVLGQSVLRPGHKKLRMAGSPLRATHRQNGGRESLGE